MPSIKPKEPGFVGPQVNLNGSSATELAERYRKAFEALRVAQKAWADAAPHARDYQTLQPGEYEVSRAYWQHGAEQLNHLAQQALGQFHSVLDQSS